MIFLSPVDVIKENHLHQVIFTIHRAGNNDDIISLFSHCLPNIQGH